MATYIMPGVRQIEMSTVDKILDQLDEQNAENNDVVGTPDSRDGQGEVSNVISDYETKLQQSTKLLTALEKELKTRTQERDSFKNKLTELEEQLTDARKKQQQNQSESQIVESMKVKSEEMLTRAKEVIFEKTKICKNQELQIEALTQQVTSLKEVVAITKDLLEIRNIEVKHLQEKLDCMDGKIGAEKERHELMHAKLEKMVQMNADLKREYETQLCLFNALRQRYSERELAKNVLENLRNGTADVNDGSNTSTSGGEGTQGPQ